MRIPSLLILDCSEELREFKSIVCEIDMPTVDIAATLDQIFSAASDEYEAYDRVADTAFWMSSGEGLFENAYLDNNAKERVRKAVLKFGTKIMDKLSYGGFYLGGEFPFRLKDYINDGTILFTKTTREQQGV